MYFTLCVSRRVKALSLRISQNNNKQKISLSEKFSPHSQCRTVLNTQNLSQVHLDSSWQKNDNQVINLVNSPTDYGNKEKM